MKGTLSVAAIRNAIAPFVALGISGCLSSQSNEPGAFVPDNADDIIVEGSVGDGPLANSDIVVRAKDGDVLARFQSDENGTYAVTISARSVDYPLLLEASGGIDLVTKQAPDFMMRSAVLNSGDSATANVNPHSTLAFEMARDLNGGIKADNLKKAQAIVVDSMNSGLTTIASSGPISTQVTTSNVAEIVKSSETLAEIVRRTRDALNASGYDIDGDQVIRELGSDLIDGAIEGNGGPRADDRTAAVAVIVSGQVMLEAMVNSLYVNGSDATEAMREAIAQVSPGTPDPTLDELAVTEGMITMAMVGLEAASAISSDPAIAQVMQAVGGIEPGTNASVVKVLMPSNFRGALNEALAMAASGDPTILETVNGVSRSGPADQPAVNRAPTISGSPRRTVTAEQTYEFMPTSSDLDGDSLTFEISGQPEWASFSESNGRLWGTPGANDAGTYSDITITVDDGQATNSVGPFSITVEPVPPVKVSIELNWTPPRENEDGSSLDDLDAYKIYWGTRTGSYPNSVRIDAPGISSYIIENLDPGTYHIVATAINRAGFESDFSNEIVRTAQ
jgi:hypothetical protein